MKLLSILLGLLTLTTAPVLAQQAPASLQALDETYGYRGARFESDTSAFRDLALAETAGQTRYYRRKSEPKTLGEGEVADVTYGFYQGKLSVILLKTRGVTNSRAVLAALQQKAGTGTRSSAFAQRYAWNGRKVHMSYDENALSNDAVVVLTCKKLKEKEMKQALKTQPTTKAAPIGS
ncbi:hypothetical protein [Hymenobacter chitinivorans]|uniref:Uncharacterized protein n=1 Tax=Hymenobacter chitinivorans DSM 11115 TaxID=1121954 RepID=A0A2M9BRM1_9BACT|nr:hypothetical protein [Hymenobacter chitinivorans]PJJ60581.1 hypothetical protein CLV45_2010 [Hymenobacter chitinivorans DSM 11115]